MANEKLGVGLPTEPSSESLH